MEFIQNLLKTRVVKKKKWKCSLSCVVRQKHYGVLT